MSKQALWLIDDAKFHIAGIATSWDYDDRATRSLTDPFPDALVNPKTDKTIRYIRQFQEQSAGVLNFEFHYTAEKTGDGVFFSLLTARKTPLVKLHTADGVFCLNGEPTDTASFPGSVRAKLILDLDAASVSLILNGRYVCHAALSESDAAYAVIGTDGTTDVTVRPHKIRLTRDFLANESFLCTDSAFPPPWQIDPAFEIRSHTASNPQMDYTYAAIDAKGGSLHRAFLPFARASREDIICEGYFLLPEGADGLVFSLVSEEEELVGVQSTDSAFYTSDGSFLRRFTPNVWQLIRFETDLAEKTVSVKIDGKLCGRVTF